MDLSPTRAANAGAPDRRGAPAAAPEGPFGVEVVSPIQPYAARKDYLCPGCEGIIEAGLGHLVIVPEHAPDLRRHWHRGCWQREQRRRWGRARVPLSPHPGASAG